MRACQFIKDKKNVIFLKKKANATKQYLSITEKQVNLYKNT